MGWYLTLAWSLVIPLAGVLAFCLAFWWKGWKAAAVVALMGVAYIGVSYFPYVRPINASPEYGFTRVVFLNARIREADPKIQAQELVARSPDVIALVEVRREWMTLVRDEVFKDYPYHAFHEIGWHDGNDIALLLSRWPLTFVGTKDANGEEPALYRVEAPEPFHMMVIHPMAPLYERAYELRNDFMVRLGSLELPQKTVVVGDFNTVPWDPAMVPLWTRDDIQRHFVWLPTYRTDMPAVPIDHVVTTAGIDDVRTHRWSDGQSDHFGLVVDFAVKKASE